jgi:hypothetical protein
VKNLALDTRDQVWLDSKLAEFNVIRMIGAATCMHTTSHSMPGIKAFSLDDTTGNMLSSACSISLGYAEESD